VGAGINGLATAYQLQKLGVGSLALLEQFELGHTRGSSHGQTRITRSTYHSPRYIELVNRAHQESWPELEIDAGEKLLLPTPGCFFGPDIEVYLDSLRQVPEVLPMIEVLEPGDARRRFPAFTFADSAAVLQDRSAAVVRAEATRAALAGLLLKRGVTVLEGCRVEGLERGDRLVLKTSRGPLETGRLVLTAGPWTAGLVPATADRLRPARQSVGYFRFDVDPALCAPGTSPVWVYAAPADHSFYGLPEYGREGLKVARHRTGPSGDDPDEVAEVMPEGARQDLLRFIGAQFAWPLVGECGAEPCFYTNTANEDFILDLHPEDSRIVVGAGFSGHGFKFGPLTGRILAELALNGKTTVAEFERHRTHFRLADIPAW